MRSTGGLYSSTITQDQPAMRPPGFEPPPPRKSAGRMLNYDDKLSTALHPFSQNPTTYQGQDIRCIPSPIGVRTPNWGIGHSLHYLYTTYDNTLGCHANGYGRSQNSVGKSKSRGMRKKNRLHSRSRTQKPPCPFARPIPLLPEHKPPPTHPRDLFVVSPFRRAISINQNDPNSHQ